MVAIERTFLELGRETDFQRYLMAARMGHRAGLTWDEILKSKRVLLVTEAGAGKTYECQRQAEQLWEVGEAAFYVDLAALKDKAFTDLLSTDELERFDRWKASQSSIATFFLDSIDELELTLGKFDAALVQFSKSVAGHLQRIRVIVTSRPIPIDEQVFRRRLPIPPVAEARPTAQDFADRAMSHAKPEKEKVEEVPEWRNVALLPLTDDQIRAMAELQNVADIDAFMKDIRRLDAEEFARRPMDLIELCADFRERQEIRTRSEQIDANINIKLKPRTERQEKAELSEARALAGAKRLALASLLHRSLTIRQNPGIDTQDSSGSTLDPSRVLSDWTAKERSTLLERPLFGFATYGRVRFHHRSVVEYLAAEELFDRLEDGMPRSSVRRLLLAETAQGEVIIRPSMRSIAGWLARRQQDIFERVRDVDPAVLLNFGDPASLSPRQRISALEAYVGRYGKGGWRGLSIPYLQVLRFASPELGPVLQRLWSEGIESPEVRQLMLKLIGAAKCPEGADIAHEVATVPQTDSVERILALDALVALRDHRLPGICVAVEGDRANWPNELARSAVDSLFPEVMAADQFCRALATITESKSAVGEFTYFLPIELASLPFSAALFETLRAGLSELIAPGTHWHEQHYEAAARRQDLLPMLTIVCERLWNSATIPGRELVASTVQALYLSSRDEPARKRREKSLRELVQDAATATRAAIFWEVERLLSSIHPTLSRWQRLSRIAFHGLLNLRIDQDWSWLLLAIGDAQLLSDRRLLALDTALTLVQREEDLQRQELLSNLQKLVVDDESLAEIVDAVSRGPDPRLTEIEAEQERNLQRRQSEIDTAHQSWIKFWEELANNPDRLFDDDRAENTVWSLWQAMSRHGSESRASGWNRQFVEDHFDKIVADRMRLGLMRIWRSDKPTLRSERPDDQKNTFLVKWQLGLAGIAAEAEDPLWASRLTPEEAQMAARYVAIELNGFPFWLDRLIAAHSEAVDSVLGEELSAELDEPPAGPMRSIALQNISYAEPEVVALFIPHLVRWLREAVSSCTVNANHNGNVQRLSDVLDILVKYGDAPLRQEIRDMAVVKLSSGETHDTTGVWLPTLLQLDPQSGVFSFEKVLEPLPILPNGEAVAWFSRLFGHRRTVAINLKTEAFTPALILRLLRLAYTYVRIADDVEHNGVYTADTRDDATQGRNNILDALLSLKGEAGWAAKVEMASDPLVTHFRDRLMVLAKETAAEEADGVAFTYGQLSDLDRLGEAAPTTRDAMFALMRDRLDDLDDLLLQDISPREGWATMTKEHILRRAIAHELRQKANRCYTVDQEAVTADEKETDIRLRSTIPNQEGTIELKLGEKGWSGADLRNALRDQLVRRYMAAEACRAGCLLITVASDRTWKHPDTAAQMEFQQLIDFLNGEAAKLIEEFGGVIRLFVKGLDLRPRLR